LLGRPNALDRSIPISVGFETEGPFATDVKDFTLTVIPKGWFAGSVVVLLVVLLVFGTLVCRSDIIRDPGPQPLAGRKPLSLAKTQMAFWLFWVLGSYQFIWLITGEYNSITPSIFFLLGISASTALGAVLIDQGKQAADGSDLQVKSAQKITVEALKKKLEEEVKELSDKITVATVQADKDDLEKKKGEKVAATATLIKQIGELQNEITTLAGKLAVPMSTGIFTDLFTDATGVSLHRFQMAAWTVVLAVVFVASVYNTLAMPEFGETILALMGISSGTYVGFKFPEKRG